MIGLDTNVLVRFLVADDEAQTERAQELIRRARDAGEHLRIDVITLVETIWVLQRFYRVDRAGLLRLVDGLLGNSVFDLADRPTIEAARALFVSGRAGFADCLISVRNAGAGCDYTATFDRVAAALPGTKLL